MANDPNTQTKLDGYGAHAIDWDRVERQLGTNVPQAPGTGGPSRHTASLTTVDSAGAPHVRPLGGVRRDGVWYLNSCGETRKSPNVANDPRCVVGLATDPFDLVLEDTAVRVTDADELSAVAGIYAEPFGATRFDL